ncbi:MAG: glutamine--fructose-6-phosphate transaminase (isomerizing), partial [Chloroflexota bacterium]|nr:glutamine--fructose-6-phosphate transaminase (isomerizing) [Chloroflexota bacterium]
VVTDKGVKLDNSHKAVSRPEHRIPWTVEDAQKGGYEHFMLKEIHEQPRVLRDTFKGRLFAAEPAINLGIDLGPRPDNILLLACGTSYHAALVGKYLLERLARIPTRTEVASEFNSAEIALSKSLAIGITQSGETADTLKALRKAKGLGCRSLAITNVVGSSATRLADQVFYIRAGPEIGVAATKSFLAQLAALYLLSLALAPLETTAREKLARELMFLPTKVQQVLDGEAQIAALGKRLAQYEHVFFVARGINFPVALEGALKLKEISYIHAEGYPAGELKHGPLALLTPHTPVIALAARDKNYDTMLSNIREIKARESPVIALAEEGDREVVKCVDEVIFIPRVDPLFSPVVNSVALQFLAYYTAREAGCPIDQPRNLAKSVTVE